MRFAALGVLGCGLVVLLAGCPSTGGNVGTEVCLACHNGQSAPDKSGYPRSAHAAVECETCHGPGFSHVRSGGRLGMFINGEFPQAEELALCGRCHGTQMAAFAQSAHALEGNFRCGTCHDVHEPEETVAPFIDNTLCLECHRFYGFETEAAVRAHTRHPVEPAATGASRCTGCHMPPLVRTNQADGPHAHSMEPIPPAASNAAIEAGITPVPPNSCSGIMGCHDGTVSTAPVFDVENPAHNDLLQLLFNAYLEEPAA